MSGIAPDAAWQSLLRDAGEATFDPAMVEDLPAAARRYLLHAIAPGAPLSTSVELEMEGRLRGKPEGKWMNLDATEVLALPGGFVWRARVHGLVGFSGYDIYAAGEGHMEWKIWGLVPLVRTGGPDVSKSARGRAVAEAAAWLPATLLPRFGARWEGIDERAAKVTIGIDEEDFEITVTVGEDGAPSRFQLDRWGNHLTPNKEYTRIPTAAVCKAEATWDGFTVPSQVVGSWWAGTRREFDFFEARLTSARYH